MQDLLTYSVENIRQQVKDAQDDHGIFVIRLYVTDDGRPAREATGRTDLFYYYPSGGTIRDRDRNIIFYEPKLDKYHSANRDG
ncbi:MAG: hypothetical protein JXA28_10795 [Bacteroidetes bacterium]|nr:hypothetical protein [Bacteroidota bacterium]